ncbi:MAG: DUF5320 domain-containing protein [Thermodesulfobacteriota bacterium]
MPRGDRTGPQGQGPMTGRGMGKCGGKAGQGRGQGIGRGRGLGQQIAGGFSNLRQRLCRRIYRDDDGRRDNEA